MSKVKELSGSDIQAANSLLREFRDFRVEHRDIIYTFCHDLKISSDDAATILFLIYKNKI